MKVLLKEAVQFLASKLFYNPVINLYHYLEKHEAKRKRYVRAGQNKRNSFNHFL